MSLQGRSMIGSKGGKVNDADKNLFYQVGRRAIAWSVRCIFKWWA